MKIQMFLFAAVLGLQASPGYDLKKAKLVDARTGAVVAVADCDTRGRVSFSSVKPGEYKLELTNGDGRSVMVADLDGDGRPDLVVAAPPRDAATGMASGKVAVQDLSVTAAAPREAGSGLATGRRQNKPVSFVVSWDGSVKGGFRSEVDAQTSAKRMAEGAAACCAVRVVCDQVPGTIELQSWSFESSKYTKTGHVTLMK